MKNCLYSPVVKGELAQEKENLSTHLAELLEVVYGTIFPCSGAKAAFKSHSVGLIVSEFGMLDSVKLVYPLIEQWVVKDSGSVDFYNRTIQSVSDLAFRSTIIKFEQKFESEDEAEKNLWEFLYELHLIDRNKYQWDPKVDQYVYSPAFGFSICGIAHFCPLLHAKASSLVRRTNATYLVLNPHWMFRDLRKVGLFDHFRDGIRKAEHTVQYNWINPKLNDHGEAPEGAQYALTINPNFDIGNCSFTGIEKPKTNLVWGMKDYPKELLI